jgi:cytochrome c oxidase cbb3-type subunit I/II
VTNAKASIAKQAQKIEDNLHSDPDFVKSYENSKKIAAAKGEEFVPMSQREIVAIIAYLQRLGTDIKVKDKTKN